MVLILTLDSSLMCEGLSFMDALASEMGTKVHFWMGMGLESGVQSLKLGTKIELAGHIDSKSSTWFQEYINIIQGEIPLVMTALLCAW